MKRQKGFTLIELLAVIVLLAVLALATIPIILGIIEEAERGALKDSAYSIESAVEFLYAKSLMQGEMMSDVVFTLNKGQITSSNANVILDFKGEILSDGKIVLSKNGTIRLALYSKSYCVSMIGGEEAILEEKKQEECVIPNLPDIPDVEPPIGVKPDESGASVPELSDNMVPIKWDGSKWVKADISVSKDWYNYDEKRWANAVTVSDASRNKYLSASVGTEIREEDILTYLVWIPRYKYKLFNVESLEIQAQTIEINFETNTTPKSVGSKNGEFLTHPAFTFGDTELNGIWVGKFETTGTVTTPCTNENCTTATLTIKPNLSSITDQVVSSMFYATRSMQRSGNIYGFNHMVDTHMMKNIEWGAVAYLTNSKYGKNSEVWRNNNQNVQTGCTGSGVNVAASANCDNTYNSLNGLNASTTGTIYGVYDMNGGAYEYVMGAMYNSDHKTIFVSKSGFGNEIDLELMTKYMDKYEFGNTYNDQEAYKRRILGDATGETLKWNKDYAYFVSDQFGNSWFIRGGYYGNTTTAGVYNFNYQSGKILNNQYSFRVVVTNQ